MYDVTFQSLNQVLVRMKKHYSNPDEVRPSLTSFDHVS